MNKLKLVLGTFGSIFLLFSMVIIYYWRDVQYEPSALDLLSYFFILPVIFSIILLAPYFIYKAYQAYRRDKKQQHQTLLEQPLNKVQTGKGQEVKEIQWFNLNIFSSSACHAWGENETIIDGLKNFKSPELDDRLENNYGLAVLSYRIQKLDYIVELQDDDSNEKDEAARLVRIKVLIQQQLEQQTETLMQVAEHLKHSALFYDHELAYQYRMHPEWNNTDTPNNDGDQEILIEQVPRLNRLNIHILLSDNVLEVWDEYLSQEMLLDFMQSLGMISQQIHLQHHYLAQQNAYADWLKLLDQISQQNDEFSLIINVDSEIDQTFLDEKMWLMDDYLSAEFASSWCVAAKGVKINNLEAIKVLKVAGNVDDLLTCLNQIMPNHADQTEQEQPFVLILDDATDIKNIKKNNQRFVPALIEPHHFLYTKPILGHTQQLAKIFGFMLGMHLPEEMTSMIYSTDQALTHAFLIDVN